MQPIENTWLRGKDLNLRPLGYEPNELPDCSTPHSYPTVRSSNRQMRGVEVARSRTPEIFQRCLAQTHTFGFHESERDAAHDKFRVAVIRAQRNRAELAFETSNKLLHVKRPRNLMHGAPPTCSVAGRPLSRRLVDRSQWRAPGRCAGECSCSGRSKTCGCRKRHTHPEPQPLNSRFARAAD